MGEKFIFLDDENNYMLVENVDYKTFIRFNSSLQEEINSLGEDFNYFYTQLEERLSRNLNRNVKINGIDLYSYGKPNATIK